MAADRTIEVWLAAQGGFGPKTLIPYVKTVDARKLTYKIEVLKNGASGNSRLNQSGTIDTRRDEPTALSQLQISVQPGDKCSVEIDLAEGTLELGRYAFDCQRPDR